MRFLAWCPVIRKSRHASSSASPVSCGPPGGPYRRIYDFPGETIESLKDLWANAQENLKTEINTEIAATAAFIAEEMDK